MLGRTHQIIGLSTGLVAYFSLFPTEYSPATLSVALVGAHFGALLPDIDQPAAQIWRSIPGGQIMSEVADSFLQHRNLTHSLFGFFLIGLGLYKGLHFLPSYWGIGTDKVWLISMLSYASHLLADAVTVEGIPLFFPYQRMYGLPPHPLAGMRIQTGGWFENLLIFPFFDLALLVAIYLLWPQIRLTLFQS